MHDFTGYSYGATGPAEKKLMKCVFKIPPLHTSKQFSFLDLKLYLPMCLETLCLALLLIEENRRGEGNGQKVI